MKTIQSSSWQAAGWTLTAAATYAAVFVVPYRFPLHQPVLSDTWIAGANNQAASVALALVSVAVTLALWYRNTGEQLPDSPEPLSTRYLPAAILTVATWTAVLGWAVARVPMYWLDEGYFLNQLRAGLVFHRTLYTQFEFAYGPLLYLWPAFCIRALAPLGVGFTAAYLVSLAILQWLGLALLFYTIQALPLRRSLKACAFVLITLGTLNSLLGLNYSIFRFILPFAAVVLLTRQRTIARAALAAGFGEIVCLATSPELGIAFAGAAIVYALYRSIRDRWQWILPALATLAGAASFAAIAGPAYFFTLGNMARGGFNLLLGPTLYILALLFAVVVLAPLAVARSARNTNNGALILAFYIAALGMIPAALGRADAIHTFSDGIGIYLLAFIALDAVPATCRRIALVVLAMILFATQAGNSRLYQYRLGLLMHPNTVHEDWGFDESMLRSAVGSASVSAPILAPQRIIDDLTRTGQYVPGYFCGWVGVWDRETEERKIADMRRTEFALVALTDPVALDPGRDRRIQRLMHMSFTEHPPRPAYIRGALLDAELASHWIQRGRFGDYMLYQRAP